ncbi:MAG: sensor histidine kinase [Verrucomicrobiales bacterium]
MKTHLGRSPRSDLAVARKLGKRALKQHVDTLALARMHETALASLEVPGLSGRSKSARLHRGTTFFNAAVSPLEENHLAGSESNGRQKSVVDTLTRRSNALAASNAKLHKEIAKLKTVEKTLRTSEAASSKLLAKAREMQEELRFLWRRLLSVQEDERRRISRELHDVIAQSLVAINVRLAVLRSLTAANAKGVREKIESTERLVEQTVELAHQFAFDLRPLVLDDLGLIPALRSFTDAFTERTGIPATLTATAAVEALETSARTALFRIAQEALANIGQHAKASRIRIDLRVVKGSVRMKISDDGSGFALGNANSFRGCTRLGLLGMRERAEIVGGTFTIESAVGKGTSLRVEIPCQEAATKDSSEEYAALPRAPKKSP